MCVCAVCVVVMWQYLTLGGHVWVNVKLHLIKCVLYSHHWMWQLSAWVDIVFVDVIHCNYDPDG